MGIYTLGEIIESIEREKKRNEQEKKNKNEIEIKTIKIEKNEPFYHPIQFNNEHTKEFINLAIKYPKAHAILYFLIDQMDNYNTCTCSYKVMQKALNCSQATIARNIRVLKDFNIYNRHY